ncbi:MAG: hypothetical protein ACRED8_07545 [Caulobacteraceae bacterium]
MPPRFVLRAAIAVFCLGVCASPASARPPAASAADALAPAVQSVIDCKGIADPTSRLACYDAAVAKMGAAEASGDLVTIDRAQRRKARREAFGLPLPSLGFLERGLTPSEANHIDVVIASASQGPYGRWTLVLDDGAVWSQVDDYQPSHDPHPGSHAAIRKGILGSYFMKIDGQQAIKVRRDR